MVCFESGMFWGLGCFEVWDVLRSGTFWVEDLVMGRLMMDVLRVGHFKSRMFSMCTEDQAYIHAGRTALPNKTVCGPPWGWHDGNPQANLPVWWQSNILLYRVLFGNIWTRKNIWIWSLIVSGVAMIDVYLNGPCLFMHEFLHIFEKHIYPGPEGRTTTPFPPQYEGLPPCTAPSFLLDTTGLEMYILYSLGLEGGIWALGCDRWVVACLRLLYRRESNLAISSSSVKNNNEQFYLTCCYRIQN